MRSVMVMLEEYRACRTDAERRAWVAALSDGERDCLRAGCHELVARVTPVFAEIGRAFQTAGQAIVTWWDGLPPEVRAQMVAAAEQDAQTGR